MNDEEFGDLYTALRDSVFTFAVRRVGAEAAKDVVAETFEVAWRKRADFPADRSSWAAWIVGIAKNKVLQELQRRQRKHHDNRFAEDWQGSSPPSSEDAARVVIDGVTGRWVYSQLTPSEQRLFDVAFFRELDVDQAATVLDISRSAYTSRVHRLRQRIIELESAASADGSTVTEGLTS